MSPAINLDRRRVVALSGAAALATMTGARAQNSFNSVRTGGGIAGGGWVQFQGGEAQFSVFGSRFVAEESDDPVLVGSLIWTDASGFSLTSLAVESYGPDPDEDSARIMSGIVLHSETQAKHSFWLRLNNLGGPGESLDTLELLIGDAFTDDAAGATPVADTAVINVSGPITVGDVQLLTFDFRAIKN